MRPVRQVTAPPASLLRAFAGVVGRQHVLTGDAAAGYAVDWTGAFAGRAAVVLRPGSTGEVAQVLRLCADAGLAVVPQGGNTGLAGGGVPLHGEAVLSLARLGRLGPPDTGARQVTAGAGVTLQQVADAAPGLDFGVHIASRASATVGGAIATNAGGLRVLRYGPMRAQVRGYDYPSLLAGSEGTLAVVTAARLRLVPRAADPVTAVAGLPDAAAVHELARRAVAEVPGLLSAEFFGQRGLAVLAERAGVTPPLAVPAPLYLLLEAAGPGAVDDLAALVGDAPVAVAVTPADRARLWACRERHPEVAGFLGTPLKLDVAVPSDRWVRLATGVAEVVAAADPGAEVIVYGHVADGNLHVNVVPAAPADGRHQDAVFSFVAELGGSISAEHGIGALKARWLPLSRSPAELALFARIRRAFDPAGILNPHVLPR
jgi:FAD/FMN-containing dehydrogenase